MRSNQRNKYCVTRRSFIVKSMGAVVGTSVGLYGCSANDNGGPADADSLLDCDHQSPEPIGDVPKKSPYAELALIPFGAVTWTDGFMKHEWSLVEQNMLATLWDNHTNGHGNYVINMQNAASGEGDWQSGEVYWADGDLYKMMEAMCNVAELTDDATLRQQLETRLHDLADTIATAQGRSATLFGERHTGYVNSHNLIVGRAPLLFDGTDYSHMGPELYNLGQLLTLGAAHGRNNPSSPILAIANRVAEYLCTLRPDPDFTYCWYDHTTLLGAVDLYRVTGNNALLDFLEDDLSSRGRDDWPNADNVQARVPIQDLQVAVGHAQRANYLFAATAGLHMERGDLRYLDAMRRVFEDVVTNKMYITGGVGSIHGHEGEPWWAGPNPPGEPCDIEHGDQSDRISEAYPAEEWMPVDSAYCEGCASCGMVFWAWNMLCATGESHFGDVLERELYNSIPAGYGREGRTFFYTNPLRRTNDVPLYSMDLPQRTRTSGGENGDMENTHCQCCPPNFARVMTSTQNMAYAVSNDKTLWVNLFGSSTLRTKFLDETPLIVTQTASNYPWDGDILLTIEAANEFQIKIRVPDWTTSATVQVGSAAAVSHPAGTYALIDTREWSCGDVVRITFPMEVRYVPASASPEGVTGRVAVMRGPIVFAAEGRDVDNDIDGLVLDNTFNWELNSCEELDGVRILTDSTKGVSLVPYFAWNNRGQEEMAVWLNYSVG